MREREGVEKDIIKSGMHVRQAFLPTRHNYPHLYALRLLAKSELVEHWGRGCTVGHAHCSHRGCKFASQHPTWGGSHLPVTPSLGDPTPSSGLLRRAYSHAHPYTQTLTIKVKII